MATDYSNYSSNGSKFLNPVYTPGAGAAAAASASYPPPPLMQPQQIVLQQPQQQFIIVQEPVYAPGFGFNNRYYGGGTVYAIEPCNWRQWTVFCLSMMSLIFAVAGFSSTSWAYGTNTDGSHYNYGFTGRRTCNDSRGCTYTRATEESLNLDYCDHPNVPFVGRQKDACVERIWSYWLFATSFIVICASLFFFIIGFCRVYRWISYVAGGLSFLQSAILWTVIGLQVNMRSLLIESVGPAGFTESFGSSFGSAIVAAILSIAAGIVAVVFPNTPDLYD